jgi:hypothetical protein
MRKKLGQILLIKLVCICILLTTFGPIAGAKPTVDKITLNPKNPAPESEVTFTVDISGNSITSAYMEVSECNKKIGLCHAPPSNISLSKIDSNTYEKKMKLKWDDVTSITYKVIMLSDGIWFKSENFTTTLKTNSETSNDSNDSPGYEILGFIIVLIGVFLIARKSKQK